MHYIHSINIIHRDIKPENVLILQDQHSGLPIAKLLDFGLSKNAGHSIAKTFVGTPCYLAPEVEYTSKGLGGKYGTPADCWSLGALLYVMLVARFPEFEMNTGAGTMTLKMPPALWNHISASAKDLILGLMTVDPSRRLTVRDVMQHPWLGEYRVSASELDLIALAEMKHEQPRENEEEDEGAGPEVPMVLDEEVEEPRLVEHGSASDPTGGGDHTRDRNSDPSGTYYQTQTAWMTQQQQQQYPQHPKIAWSSNSDGGGGSEGSGAGTLTEIGGEAGRGGREVGEYDWSTGAVVVRGPRQVVPSSTDPQLPFAPLLNLQR